jgi:MFS family permease
MPFEIGLPERAAPRPLGTATSRYALGLLVLVYVFAMLDRTILTVLLQPIKEEFRLSDTELGFVSGLAFAVAYSIGALPAGYLADRVRRRMLLGAIVALWSALTFVSSFATGFLFLCITRLGVGLAEAGEAPTIMSLVGDLFPQRRRATAVSLIYLGVPFGLLIGFLVAGSIAAHHGWRAAMMTAGLPGVLLGILLFFTLPDPPRGAHDAMPDAADVKGSLPSGFRLIAGSPPLLHALIGAGLASIVASVFSVWAPSLFIRKFHVGIDVVGPYFALSLGTAGFFGSLLCGPLADRLGAGRFDRIARVSAGFIVLLAPLMYLTAQVGSFALGLAMASAFNFVVPGYLGSLHGLVLGLTPARRRGFMVAMLAIMINLVGYGLGPQIAGILSDAFAKHGFAAPLELALAVMSLCALWSAGHLLYAARLLSRSGAKASR